MKVKKIFLAFKKELTKLPTKECIVGKRLILLCRVKNKYYVTDGICTHEQIPLAAGGLHKTIITCPMHGAKFDVTTGEVKALPATETLKTYSVEVQGEKIYAFV